jgi:hypothetical protein
MYIYLRTSSPSCLWFGLHEKGPSLAEVAIQQERIVGRFSLSRNDLDDFIPQHSPQHGTHRCHLGHARLTQGGETFRREFHLLVLEKVFPNGLVQRVGFVVFRGGGGGRTRPVSRFFLILQHTSVLNVNGRRRLLVKPIDALVQRDVDELVQWHVGLQGNGIQQLLALFGSVLQIRPKSIIQAPCIPKQSPM